MAKYPPHFFKRLKSGLPDPLDLLDDPEFKKYRHEMLGRMDEFKQVFGLTEVPGGSHSFEQLDAIRTVLRQLANGLYDMPMWHAPEIIMMEHEAQLKQLNNAFGLAELYLVFPPDWLEFEILAPEKDAAANREVGTWLGLMATSMRTALDQLSQGQSDEQEPPQSAISHPLADA